MNSPLEETSTQRFIGARDLTHWPSATGRLAVRLWRRAGRWLAPNQVLALTLLIGLVAVAALTAGAAAVYDAVTEADGVAALDQPALDAAMALRSSSLNEILGAYTHLGDTPALPIAATVIADAVPPFEHSFSFPSGHTLNAVAIAGIVAYLLIRWQPTRSRRTSS